MAVDIEDYILILDDIVSDSLCKQVIEEYEPTSLWSEATMRGNVVNKNLRNLNAIDISSFYAIQQNPSIRGKIDFELFKCSNKVISIYKQKFPLVYVDHNSGYELFRYSIGHFCKDHIDSFKLKPRVVSCSFSLNDNYEGGEWSFFNGEKIFKAPKGSAVLFPSTFLYPHGILPVTNGSRYSIVTWFI